MLIKSTLVKDNEKAAKSKLSTAEFESLGGAVGTLVKMKTDNIQALLNFTEILLQKMQLDVARDLALENFNAADPVQAAGDFNLDNYRLPRRRQPNWKRKAVQSRKNWKSLKRKLRQAVETF